MPERYNPWAGCKYAPFYPSEITGEVTDDQGRVSYTLKGGIPQITIVRGVPRRNWRTPEKGKKPTLNAKVDHPKDCRFGFAQMWRTPKRVGYYGGNFRRSDGGWTIRVRWSETDISQGYIDLPREQLRPIYKLPSGRKLPPVWRKQGHIKSKGKPKPKRVFKTVESVKPKPALGLRVVHRVHGPGTVQGVTGTSERWYAEIRYDMEPFGPQEEHNVHEYGPETLYDLRRFQGIEIPKAKRTLALVRTTPDKRSIQDRFRADCGRSAMGVENARAREDRDLTEFAVTDDGQIRRHTVGFKSRAKPKEDCIPSAFLREAGLFTHRPDGSEW